MISTTHVQRLHWFAQYRRKGQTGSTIVKLWMANPQRNGDCELTPQQESFIYGKAEGATQYYALECKTSAKCLQLYLNIL